MTTDQLTATTGGTAGRTAVADPATAKPRAGNATSATTASSRRAYERRQRRHQKITAARLVGPGKPVATALDRAPFVVVLIALLAGGIASVLFLNTVTDEAGMRTSAAKSKSSELRLTIEALQRDVALLDATPKIADEATALGMVPAGDSAMLMIDGSGTGSVIGEPTVVPGPVPPAAPVDPAAEAAAAAAAAANPAPPPTDQAAIDQAAADAAAAAAAAASQAPVDPVAAQAAADAAAAQVAADAAAAQVAADAAAAQVAADAAAAQAAAQAQGQAQAQADAAAAAGGATAAGTPVAPAEGAQP